MSSTSHRVLALLNPKAGLPVSAQTVLKALSDQWETRGHSLFFQVSRSIEDGQEKTRAAVADGADTVIVVGGDGMINSIGSVLVDTDVALGVIPTGSGNGFARHFGIPLKCEEAAAALVKARRMRIDVGRANGRPFFVTCSMAWDAAIVRSFEKSPVRGIVPYVFAAVVEFFEYERQPFIAKWDGETGRAFEDPLLFTVANLTQFGGNAKIAPHACPDDGLLELVAVERRDAPMVIANLPRLFNGTLDRVGQVHSYRISQLTVEREKPAPIQIDGELVDATRTLQVDVLPRALSVLVPGKSIIEPDRAGG